MLVCRHRKGDVGCTYSSVTPSSGQASWGVLLQPELPLGYSLAPALLLAGPCCEPVFPLTLTLPWCCSMAAQPQVVDPREAEKDISAAHAVPGEQFLVTSKPAED